MHPQLTLSLQAGTQADALTVYAEAGATSAVDAAFDAVKLSNPSGLNLSVVAATSAALAIQALPALAAGNIVPLSLTLPAAGTARFTATVTNLPAGLTAYLTDALTGARHDLRPTPAQFRLGP